MAGKLVVFGSNPDHSTKGAVRLGRVHNVQYVHDEEGAREHDFDGHEIIELLPDGSVRIYDPRGGRLWDEF